MSMILLVRHGQASFGAANYDVLSPLGFRQAETVGRSLLARGVRVDRAVSGTLDRQRDTARTALAVAGSDVTAEVDAGWNEYDHDLVIERFGDTGRADANRAFQAELEVALRQWSAGVGGTGLAPEWAEFSAGVRAGFDAVTDGLGSGQTVVVFTSGGVISALCIQLLGLPPTAMVALNRVTVNGAITKIVHGRRGSTLVSFNDHAHFEGEHADQLSYR